MTSLPASCGSLLECEPQVHIAHEAIEVRGVKAEQPGCFRVVSLRLLDGVQNHLLVCRANRLMVLSIGRVRGGLRLQQDIRKILRQDLVARAHHAGALDAILQPPSVAWPAIMQKAGGRLAKYSSVSPLAFFAVFLQKMVSQHRDFFPPFSKWRH